MKTGDGKPLKFGLYVPNFGKASHPRTISNIALEAERHGWDGFFLWDHLVEWDRRVAINDSFISLSAIAVKTSRIRIGTTLTPLPRLKPWIAARQAASLDQLSDGRMILGVGLGAKESCDYARFGEPATNRVLAEKLDESLAIIEGLWTGKPFRHKGKHYKMGNSVFLPTPKQKPRIPVWVGGFWPRKRPFKRAARWDGVIPLRLPEQLPQPRDIREITDFINKHREKPGPFEVVNIGWTTGTNRKRDAEKISPYVDSGITWWLESLYTKRDSSDGMLRRIRQGPPKVT
jgi:alkanesulfonate monooxygenase SsuD/methylene tetrahydromethanopterin reductase-like flavin-dependent oxidoreductase (luciferase family)